MWQQLPQAEKGDAQNVQGLGEIKPLADGSVIATATLRGTAMRQDYIWRSNDGGKSFALSNPIGDRTGETHILQLPSGRMLAAIRTVYDNYDHPRNKRTAMAVSDDNGYTWTEPELLTTALGDCISYAERENHVGLRLPFVVSQSNHEREVSVSNLREPQAERTAPS